MFPPRENRHNVMLSARLERFGAPEPTTHRIRNLSRNGVCVDRADRFKRGETVLVTVGEVQCVGATIRWVEAGRAGLKFAQPIQVDSARTNTILQKKPDPISRPLEKIRFSFAD